MVKIILDTEDIALILLVIIWFVIAIRFAIKDKIEEVKENRKKKKGEKEDPCKYCEELDGEECKKCPRKRKEKE